MFCHFLHLIRNVFAILEIGLSNDRGHKHIKGLHVTCSDLIPTLCHLIVGRAVSEISINVWKYFQRFHRNRERVQVGQEEVRVVDKDLVVQLL